MDRDYGSFIERRDSLPGFKTTTGLTKMFGTDAPLSVLVVLLYAMPLCTFGLEGESLLGFLSLAYGVGLSITLLVLSYGRPLRWALYSIWCLLSCVLGAGLGIGLRNRATGYKNLPLVFSLVLGYFVLSFILHSLAFYCGYPLLGSSAEFKKKNGWGWNEEAAVCMLYGVDDSGAAGFDLVVQQKYPAFLAEGLLEYRACWSGEPAADYIFHLANDHAFLGILLCHPAHPFDRLERILVLVVLCLLIVFPVAVSDVAISNDIVESILVLLLVSVPRNVLKLILKKQALEKDEEVLRSSTVAHDRTRYSLIDEAFIYAKILAVTGVIVASSCIYLGIQHELKGRLLLDACTGIAYFFVLEFIMQLLLPVFIEEGVVAGFFGHWWSERYKYADEDLEKIRRRPSACTAA